MTRRFQFSLRALLVALTIACLLLGWKIDQARRRGLAIDAVAEAGCGVVYLDHGLLVDDSQHSDHLWADLKGVPVLINLHTNVWSEDERVFDAIATQLSRIHGITEVCGPAGFLMPPPDLRKWKRTLSRILPASALQRLQTPDWVIEANIAQKRPLADLPKKPIAKPAPQQARSRCAICGKVHESE